MEEIVKLIPNSFSALIGLIVIIFVLIMVFQVAAKAGDLLWRKWTSAGREKRHDHKEYQGIERRADASKLEKAVTDLVEAITENTKELQKFVSTWNASHFELKESVDEIKRVQKSNWHRFFTEELAGLRERFKGQ